MTSRQGNQPRTAAALLAQQCHYYTTVYRSQDGNEGLRLDYKGREGCHKQIPSMCMANTIHLRPNNTGKLVSTEIQWWWCFVGPPNTHTSDILTKQSLIIVSQKSQNEAKNAQKDWSRHRSIDDDVLLALQTLTLVTFWRNKISWELKKNQGKVGVIQKYCSSISQKRCNYRSRGSFIQNRYLVVSTYVY